MWTMRTLPGTGCLPALGGDRARPAADEHHQIGLVDQRSGSPPCHRCCRPRRAASGWSSTMLPWPLMVVATGSLEPARQAPCSSASAPAITTVRRRRRGAALSAERMACGGGRDRGWLGRWCASPDRLPSAGIGVDRRPRPRAPVWTSKGRPRCDGAPGRPVVMWRKAARSTCGESRPRGRSPGSTWSAAGTAPLGPAR